MMVLKSSVVDRYHKIPKTISITSRTETNNHMQHRQQVPQDTSCASSTMAATLDSKSPAPIEAVDPIRPAPSDKDDVSATAGDAKSAAPPPVRAGGWLQWHEPGTSAEEKKLIFKLDWFLLSISCLLFFIKQVALLAPPQSLA